jgi:hypothetical protein
MLKNYNKLPDYLPKDVLKKYFYGLLETASNSEDVDVDSIINGLWELANRQWHTYTVLDDNIKSRIDKLIIQIFIKSDWKNKPVVFLRSILSIIGNLGLVDSYKLIKDYHKQEKDSPYQQEIDNFIDGIDKHRKGQVEDPFVS